MNNVLMNVFIGLILFFSRLDNLKLNAYNNKN